MNVVLRMSSYVVVFFVSLNLTYGRNAHTELPLNATWYDDLQGGIFCWQPDCTYNNFYHGFWGANNGSILTRTFYLPKIESYTILIQFSFIIACSWDKSLDSLQYSILLNNNTIHTNNDIRFDSDPLIWSTINQDDSQSRYPFTSICSNSNFWANGTLNATIHHQNYVSDIKNELVLQFGMSTKQHLCLQIITTIVTSQTKQNIEFVVTNWLWMSYICHQIDSFFC